MSAGPLIVRPFIETDWAHVIDLWRQCGLTVPYNEPNRDINFAKGRENSDIWSGWSATCSPHRSWLAMTAIADGFITSPSPRNIRDKAEAARSPRPARTGCGRVAYRRRN